MDSDEWIAKLKPFKQFIHDILSSKKKPAVRVALLDDGAKLADLNGKQKGASFRPDNEEYFVGPCSHGTEMARCIREICPMAELHIARLDDSQNVENQKFTTASAYKVRLTVRTTSQITRVLNLFPGSAMGNRNGGGHYLHELDVQNEGQ